MKTYWVVQATYLSPESSNEFLSLPRRIYRTEKSAQSFAKEEADWLKVNGYKGVTVVAFETRFAEES